MSISSNPNVGPHPLTLLCPNWIGWGTFATVGQQRYSGMEQGFLSQHNFLDSNLWPSDRPISYENVMQADCHLSVLETHIVIAAIIYRWSVVWCMVTTRKELSDVPQWLWNLWCTRTCPMRWPTTGSFPAVVAGETGYGTINLLLFLILKQILVWSISNSSGCNCFPIISVF